MKFLKNKRCMKMENHILTNVKEKLRIPLSPVNFGG